MARRRGTASSIRCIDGVRVSTRYLARTLARARKILSIPRSREVNIILCGTRTIRRLNRRYRHANRVTDVLSFDYGEIFTCVPQARRQARQYGNLLNEELQLLMIHGVLHVLGYDHATARGAKRMRSLENKLLGKELSRSVHA